MDKKCMHFTLLTLIVLITACSQSVEPDLVTLGRQNSLLYDRYNEDARNVIVKMNINETVEHQWLEQQDATYPSRSPDGAQVAYFVYEGTEVFSLWVADNLGKNARKIGGPYPFYAGNMAAEWSFDARYLAFRVSPDPHQALIYVVDADIGEEMEIVTGWDSAWSRQNNQLVVYTGSVLQVLDIETQVNHHLLDVYIPNPTNSLDWLLDQQTVLFLSDVRRWITGIYAVDVESHEVRLILPDDPDLSYRSLCCLKVSPNGEYVAFVVNSQSLSETASIATLMILNINNTEIFPVGYSISGPIAWSPDSNYIVFGSLKDEVGNPIGSWDLFLFSLNKRSVTRLTHDGAAPTGLTW